MGMPIFSRQVWFRRLFPLLEGGIVFVIVGSCSGLNLFGLGKKADTPETRLGSKTTSNPRGYGSQFSIPLSKEGRDDTVHVVQLAFLVERYDLPYKDVRHTKKIWNHVDEMRAGARRTAQMARNGLRVGVASEDSWPAIATILQASDARRKTDELVAQPGLPVTILLGTIHESESFFSYSSGNELLGKTLPSGEKLILVDYVFRAELGGTLDVKLSFEVRRDLGEMNWEQQEAIIRQVPAVERHVFEELGLLLTLRAGEFLIVGPSEKADIPYLTGSRFFIQESGGVRSAETLICIRPRPFQTTEQRPNRS
ncbi:MAG: hypothetical protein AABZ47_06460 [Planctomycetota bacterium]